MPVLESQRATLRKRRLAQEGSRRLRPHIWGSSMPRAPPASCGTGCQCSLQECSTAEQLGGPHACKAGIKLSEQIFGQCPMKHATSALHAVAAHCVTWGTVLCAAAADSVHVARIMGHWPMASLGTRTQRAGSCQADAAAACKAVCSGLCSQFA